MTKERAIEILNFDLDILGQYGDGTAEAYKMAIKALEQQLRWIPVSERLPEDNSIVLVTFADGSVGTSSWHESTKYNNGFDKFLYGLEEDPDLTETFGVMAWMPLPEPYEESEEKE